MTGDRAADGRAADASADTVADAVADRIGAAVLRRVLPHAFAARAIEWQPLRGGLNVRSFLVTADAQRWVLRLPLPGAPALIDVATEARVMRAAADAGIAPAVVAIDAGSQALLTEFAGEARAWDAAQVRAPANIVRVAEMLRTLHGVEVEVPSYNAAAIARRYATALATRARLGHERAAHDGDAPRARAPAANSDARRAAELATLAQAYDSRHAPRVLCHNDLAAANILDDGSRLKLIDFEYAVRSAPILDLAGLVAMNDYSSDESRALLGAYYGAAADVDERELADVVRMIRLMSYFWARIGERAAADPEPYAQLAARMAEHLRV